MRLIDADTAAAFAENCGATFVAKRLRDSKAFPDVAVRCKDCKHYLIADEFDGGKRYMCEVNHFSYLNSDGDMHFCSYGEPKEDTHADDHD